MIGWYLYITLALFGVSLLCTLYWKSEFNGSTNMIKNKQFKENSYNWSYSEEQLNKFLVKEQRFTKWSVYTMFLSPFWPALVVVLPLLLIKILVSNLADAVKIAIKEK